MPKTGFLGQKPVSVVFRQIASKIDLNKNDSFHIRSVWCSSTSWFRKWPYFWDEVPKNTKKPQKTFQKPDGFEILITPGPEVCASLRIYTSRRHMLENISWKFQLERTLPKISAFTILNTSLVHVHAKIFSIIFSLEKWLKRKNLFINRKLRCSTFIIY